MYRASLRSTSRPAQRGLRSAAVRPAPRRFASTVSPVDKSRTWKSSAVRWGLAVGAVYYYSTSSVFADEQPGQTYAPAAFSASDDRTVEAIVEAKRKQIRDRAEKPPPQAPTEPSRAPEDSAQSEAQTAVADGSPAAPEGESQEGAFNPETGEINWDCPCLGGMAHGPCGEDFKTAFSCFVFSEEDPKGMDCIDKFQGMQECFKKYPEIYGAELQDDDDADAADAPVESSGEAPVEVIQQLRDAPPTLDAKDNAPETSNTTQVETAVEEPVPAKWDDATAANQQATEEQVSPREAADKGGKKE